MSKGRGIRGLGKLISWVSIVVLVGALSSCTTNEKASSLPMPSLIWEPGQPTGVPWNSPWAQAYLNASTQLTLAQVYGDFSDPATVTALGYDSAVSEAADPNELRFSGLPNETTIAELRAEYAFYGTILSIDEAPDGNSAVVDACYMSLQGGKPQLFSMDWTISKDPAGRYSAEHEGGVLRTGECPETPPWVARWSSPIDLDSITRDRVKMPLPREYYVKLGVISE